MLKARAARPRPPRVPPRAASPHPEQSIPEPQPVPWRAQVGLPEAGSAQLRTGSIPSSVPAPAPAPFPVFRWQRPSRSAARQTGRSRTGSWRLPAAMLGAQSERPSAQIPPPRSAPANLNNSVRRREHVQSGALPPAPEILMPRDEPSRESRGGWGTRSHSRPGQGASAGAGLSPERPHTRNGRHCKRSRHPQDPGHPAGCQRGRREDPRGKIPGRRWDWISREWRGGAGKGPRPIPTRTRQ